MRNFLSTPCLAACLALACCIAPAARAHDAASAVSTLSALPLASVAVGASAAGDHLEFPVAPEDRQELEASGIASVSGQSSTTWPTLTAVAIATKAIASGPPRARQRR